MEKPQDGQKCNKREYNKKYYEKNKERIRKQKKEYYQRVKHQVRERDLKRIFGISIEEYDNMYELQGGLCKICGLEETASCNFTGNNRRLAVDHCHINGSVRGLLCGKCNRGLGYFQDDIMLLEKAKQYLRDAYAE